MQINITIGGKKHRFDKGILLCDALDAVGVHLHYGCGKCGRCGKCAVQCVGSLSQMTDDEKSILAGKSGFRLACRARAEGDCEIILPLESGKSAIKTETAGEIKLSASKADGIGYAVDIGTTTVYIAGFDLATGKQISSFAAENPQRAVGDDVVSRIGYCMSGGTPKMHEMICDLIDSATPNAASRVIVGNTAMMLISAAKDPSPLGYAPYDAPEKFGMAIGDDYYPDCIHGFAGSDLTAAMLACDITDGEPALLCDIGTNCEMALFDGKRLAVCSAAAGPCFEGYGIKCGMPAADGAINRVFLDKSGELKYTVIGNTEPKGICGSGLIDLVSCLALTGVITSDGYMPENIFLQDVEITPKDVCALQLAKAAVKTGIDMLVDHLGIDLPDIKTLYLAGGFGSNIDINSACNIKMIPSCLAKAAVSVGNAAARGAAMMLCGDTARKKCKELAHMAEYLDLTTSSTFNDRFTDALFF